MIHQAREQVIVIVDSDDESCKEDDDVDVDAVCRNNDAGAADAHHHHQPQNNNNAEQTPCCGFQRRKQMAVVEGAGLPSINGVYEQDGICNGVAKYSRFGEYMGDIVLFVLYKCIGFFMMTTEHWYISIVRNDDRLPGTSDDIDFYSVPVTEHCLAFPPAHGWSIGPGCIAQDPPPTVTIREQQVQQRTSSGMDNTRYGSQPQNDSEHNAANGNQAINTALIAVTATINDSSNQEDSNHASPITLHPAFEINKVAIIGGVGAGKTTVLNALLQEKFREVLPTEYNSIAIFRMAPLQQHLEITTVNTSHAKRKAAALDDEASNNNAAEGEISRKIAKTCETCENDIHYQHDTTIPMALKSSLLTNNREPCLGQSKLPDAENDDKELMLREIEHQPSQQSKIQLHGPLYELWNKATLEFLDVPSRTKSDEDALDELQQPQFLREQWDSLSCVVVVLDATEKVDKQLDHLKLVKANLDQIKTVPVIVLCNKIDDFDNKESEMIIVHEMQAQVEAIFQVGNRSESLKQVLAAFHEGNRLIANGDEFPIFLPVCAMDALAYRTATTLCDSMHKFKQLDRKLIEKLGLEEIGTFKWKKLSLEEKYKTAFDIINDAEQYKERMNATNFDKFIAALTYSIGGDKEKLLKNNYEVSLQQLSMQDGVLKAQKLRCMYYKCICRTGMPHI